MSEVTLTGEVIKSYGLSRKSGYSKFFFEMQDKDGETHKGMAPVQFLGQLWKGNVVEIEGKSSRGWLTPCSVRVWYNPVRRPQTIDHIEVGHVGQPRPTHWGQAASTKLLDGSWLTIPCSVMREYFEGETADDDKAYQMPGRGMGEMYAAVWRDGDEQVVTQIRKWKPWRKEIDAEISFSDIYWDLDYISFKVNGERLRMSTSDLPFPVEKAMLTKMPAMTGSLQFKGVATAYSEGWRAEWPGRVGWEWEGFTMTVVDSLIEQIEALVESDKVARATAAVRRELKDLWTSGVVVDLTMVEQMFLSKGIETTEQERREIWSRGYDVRYLETLRDLALDLSGSCRMWACSEGFVVLIGDWLVWERCTPSAATYILPAKPNDAITGEELGLEEWVSVLGKILPESKKMDLRYGEVGQVLAGNHEGVQFAFHVTGDDGEIGSAWVAAVANTVGNPPTFSGDLSGLPGLDDLLALVEGGEK
jgi:hypothetical protein